ncbi:MAG TPA: bifunctional 3-phenylpropionate/cinnamic acid dioxygenase ferredoxin subunit [Symbiobacteriaceae bacterium]|nr:bifunctional 3-phenylpropionate/cinnamic acid dioxygenase ferredoxin subunit [Symbiobacteriaceae bacterium]
MALHKVADVHEIPEGKRKRVLIKRRPIAVFNCNGTYYAVDDTCSHADASLAEGEFLRDKCQVACPLHGARFDLKTGDALSLPAVTPVDTYAVTIEGTAIMVEV